MKTNRIALPYLWAIKSCIENAFPGSSVVVLAEDPLFPDENYVDIKARADNDWASVPLYPYPMCSAEHIARLLISMIQEQRGKE